MTDVRLVVEDGVTYAEVDAVVAWLAKADEKLAAQLRQEVDRIIRAGVEEVSARRRIPLVSFFLDLRKPKTTSTNG